MEPKSKLPVCKKEMNLKMKKNYAIFFIIYCLIYWIGRLTCAKVIPDLEISISTLQLFDIFFAIIFIAALEKYYSDKFLSGRKRKIMRATYPFIILLSLSFEPLIANFRHFPDSLDKCVYYTKECKANTLYYQAPNENEDGIIYIFNDYVSVDRLVNNYWQRDDTKYKYNYFDYQGEDYFMEVFPINNKYFIYLYLGATKNINDIKDNTNIAFDMLHPAKSRIYQAHNYYGKLIDDFSNYNIQIEGKTVEFKEKK